MMSVKKEAFSAVRWTTFATVGRVILQTLQLIVLARLISPQDFGMMAMILSVTAFIQLFGDLGVSTTIIYSREISKEVLSTLYWLNLAMGALLSGLVWIASPWVASFYGTPGLEIPLSLAGSSFLLLAIGQQVKILAEKRLAFRSIAIVELLSATVSTIVAVVVAYLGGGVYSLVAAVMVLAAGNSIMYWLFARNGWLPLLHFGIREALPNIKAGLYLLGTSLANTATLQADVMIVGRLMSGVTLGFYTVPRELCLKVMFATNPIITRVGTPLIAKTQLDPALLKKVYLTTIRMTSAINFPIYGAIAVFRYEVVDLVLGSKWASSADLLGIMAVWGMFRALGNPVGSLLYGTGNAKMALYQSVSVTLAIIPSIYIGGIWGASGVAVALTLFYVVFVFAVWLLIVRKLTGAGFWEYTQQWTIPLFATALTAAVAFVSAMPFQGTLPRLFVGLPVGGITYLAISWFINRQWCMAMLGMLGLVGRRAAPDARSDPSAGKELFTSTTPKEQEMGMELGFLLMAFGKPRYVEQAVNLARSLRRFMPDIPIALASDKPIDSTLFDHFVEMDMSRGGSFKQKLWLDSYSPFEKTLFIDSDCIVGSPFHDQLESLMSYSFTPVCERYLNASDIDEDGWVIDVGKALQMVGGDLYPKFNGGVYYFDKSDASRRVFSFSRELLPRADELGLKNPSGGEPGDETLFALALSSLKMLPLYDDAGELMRTPIGRQGHFGMADFGSFTFKKYGLTVSPAICHFSGANVYSLPYLRISEFLRNEKISLYEEVLVGCRFVFKSYPYYLRILKYKASSIFKSAIISRPIPIKS